MELIDLDLYRWKYFNDFVLTSQRYIRARTNTRSLTDYKWWWKENGAFVLTAPRQSGKTEFIIRAIKLLPAQDDYVVVCPNSMCVKNIVSRGVPAQKVYTYYDIEHIHNHDLHLFVDEYYHVDRSVLLSHPWRSVTMVGSLV